MYPAQQNATDQTANFFWLLVIVMGAFLVFWWLERQWLVWPVYIVRYYELSLTLHCFQWWNAFMQHLPWLHLPMANMDRVAKVQHYILHASPKDTTFKEFSTINRWVGDLVRYPMLLIMLSLAGLLYFKMGNRKFAKVYSMDSLYNAECDVWPQIKPVASLDLLKEDIEKGPWAMAQQPLEFSQSHQMASTVEKDGRMVWKLDQSVAYRVLTVQLGPLWTTADKLPIHMKALLVVFLSRAIREREVGNQLLRQIAASAASGQLNFEGVEKQFQVYRNHKIIQWVQLRHAYVYTVMATLLDIARADGVLASAEFLWLKPLDRRLWYVLNSVGRQTAVVEVAGAFSHWKAEQKLGRALRSPMVKEGVKALSEALEDTLFVAKGESWRTFNEA